MQLMSYRQAKYTLYGAFAYQKIGYRVLLMHFSYFFDQFPDLVDSEFRNIYAVEHMYDHIPSDNYAFVELFCHDADCDCHNTIIHVVTNNPYKLWAIIRYGWKSKSFYNEWMGGGNLKLAELLAGISLDALSPKNAISRELLQVFKNMITEDSKYGQRIQGHYAMFKDKIKKAETTQRSHYVDKQLPPSSVLKTKRNEQCSCGSGKKYKKCCLLIH